MASWQEDSTLVIWLAVGLLLLILIVGALLLFTRIYVRQKIKDADAMAQAQVQHQQKMLVNSIEVQEKERARIAIDIHDGLMFDLSVLSLLIDNPNKTQEAKELLANCTTSARQISHDLTPPLIEGCQLDEILESILYQISSHDTNFFRSGDAVINFETAFKLNITRIIQEMINNTIKHANAKRIDLFVRSTTNYLAIVYKDDGAGMSEETKEKGLGLKNLDMRVNLLEGIYQLKTGVNQGVKYSILIPTKE